MITNKETTQTKLQTGVNLLADTVKVTLGAKGRTVMFNKVYGQPHITKDGVTVAKQVFSDDPMEQMAIQVVREAAERTVKSSGDGTTTTTILAQYLINSGYEMLKDYDYHTIAEIYDNFKDEAIKYIKDNSISVEDNFEYVRRVATVSANDAKIGNFLYEILKEISIYGSIEVKESHAPKTRIEKVKGIKINKGYYAPHFCSDPTRLRHEASQVGVLIYNDRVFSLNDLTPYINFLSSIKKPLLVLANEVDPTALSTILQMKLAAGINIMIVENDGFGDRKLEIMHDIAAMTDAVVIDKDNKEKLKETPEEVLGYAEEILVDMTSTSIIGGQPNEELVKKLIEDTKYQLEKEDNDPDALRYYRRRMATLAGGVAVIYVGGTTEVEMKEKKDRIDDAVEAVRAAIKMGVNTGGGYTWYMCLNNITDNCFVGDGMLKASKCLMSVVNQLAKNSGKDYQELVDAFIENKPYDLKLDKQVPIDEYEVYDPTSVLVDSISNAVAVAKSILSVERVIFSQPTLTDFEQAISLGR